MNIDGDKSHGRRKIEVEIEKQFYSKNRCSYRHARKGWLSTECVRPREKERKYTNAKTEDRKTEMQQEGDGNGTLAKMDPYWI